MVPNLGNVFLAVGVLEQEVLDFGGQKMKGTETRLH